MAGEVLQVSAEELAVVFAHLGHADQASGLLVLEGGRPVSREEADARLRAASHSLLAREWLSVDDNAQVTIASPLVELAQVASEADYSLRCDFATPQAEFRLAFHIAAGHIVRHTMGAGIVHSLGTLTLDELLDEVVAFYRAHEVERPDCPPGTIPATLLEAVGQFPDETALKRALEQAGVNSQTAVLFAADVRSPEFRGSILRVEYDAERLPQSNQGLLVLRGAQRLWLVQTEELAGTPSLTLLPADASVLRESVAALVPMLAA